MTTMKVESDKNQENFYLSPIDRRQFLTGGLFFLGSGLLLPRWLKSNMGSGCTPASPKALVAIVQSDKVRIARNRLNAKVIQKLLDKGLQGLFPGKSITSIWRELFKPGDVVAVKLNCIAGKGLSPNKELVQAIVTGLRSAGVKNNNIILFDRMDQDLRRAGYEISTRRGQIRCVGNDHIGYSRNLLIHKSIGSVVSRIVTEYATAIINVPVLKDHGIVGISIGMKNFFGVIHNPNKYHINAGDPYVADLCSHPWIRDKLRLTICDALTAQFEGGPPYMPQWAWPFNGLLISQDMVAIDYVGWQIIEEKRQQAGLKSLREVGREPKYILTAADKDHHLGVADPRLIEVKRLTI